MKKHLKKVLKPFISIIATTLAYSGMTRLMSRSLASKILVRIPESLKVGDTVAGFRGIFLKVPKDDSVGRVLKFMDQYKPIHTGFFESLLAGKKLFFDFGAHIGMYTNLAAKNGVRSVAIEADPSLCQYYIRQSLSLNGYLDLTNVVAEAVSDRKGTATFWLHRVGNSGAGRLYKIEDRDESPMITVPTDTLDSFAKRYGRPDLIKVHIEGAETLMIKGSHEIFQGNDAPILIIEFHVPDIEAITPGTTAQDLVNKLVSYGYMFKTLTEPKYRESMWHIFYKKELPQDSLKFFTEETQNRGGVLHRSGSCYLKRVQFLPEYETCL